jgi:hypothetical protein
MSPEPTERMPKTEHSEEEIFSAEDVVNPNDLVYSGGTNKDPKELVENPAVTPEMLNEPGDLRADEMNED